MVVLTQNIHARIISGTVVSGQLAAGTAVIESELIPALSAIEGYEGCDLLVADDDRFEYLTWWSACPLGTEDLIAQLYAELLEKFGGIIEVPEHVRYIRTLYHRQGGDAPLPPID